MESLYRHHSRPEDFVPEELFRGVLKTLDSAVSVEFQKEYPELCKVIADNNGVFAAFKVHDQCERMARLLTGDDGQLRPFREWVKLAEPISDHHNRVWLRTEYDTAVRRAAQARDWMQFREEKDALPNLRWVPSTAATPGADHMVFWNTVRPVDDAFWSAHRPGDRWGCQCSLEATDDPATDVPKDVFEAPDPGLDNNPADDGKLFSDSHPYFPDSCTTCPFNTGYSNSGTPTNKGKDCINCTQFQKCIAGYMKQNPENVNRLAQKLTEDPAYKDVKFNPETGSLTATHVSHNVDKGIEQKIFTDSSGKQYSGKELEIECQKTIYAMGEICILEAESIRVNGQLPRSLDATIMNERMDIASVTKNEGNIFFNTISRKEKQLLEFNAAFGAQSHCLAIYFHEAYLYNEDAVRNGLKRYLSSSRYHNAVDTVYCIIRGTNDIVIIKEKGTQHK